MAILLVLAVIILLGAGGRQMVGPFNVERQPPISLAPSALPYYALRTTMRMLSFQSSHIWHASSPARE